MESMGLGTALFTDATLVPLPPAMMTACMLVPPALVFHRRADSVVDNGVLILDVFSDSAVGMKYEVEPLLHLIAGFFGKADCLHSFDFRH